MMITDEWPRRELGPRSMKKLGKFGIVIPRYALKNNKILFRIGSNQIDLPQ